ncbi:MAG: hypothetical protein WAL25_03100 [Acidimicrobiia bacterium]|jgi:hypothetical protein
MPRKARIGAVILIACTLLLSGCGRDDRPDTATWLPAWDSMTSVVPSQSELGEPPSEDLCQDTLAGLREQNEGLLPSPSVTVDDLVAEWIAVAEAAFFDCPPEGEDINSFSDAYEELDRIEQSVDTALTDET